jgi:spoIIIJ-associated protein
MSEEKQENRARQGEEFRGKTVEAAVSMGLAAWRVSRDEVEIEVIKPGSRGVLGIGAEDAVVRLSMLTASAQGRTPAQVPAAVTKSKPQGDASRTTQPTEDRKQAPAKSASSRDDAGGAPRRGRASEQRPRSSARVDEPAAQTPSQEGIARTGDAGSMTAVLHGQEILQGLLDRMNLRARVEVVPQSDAEADEGERFDVLNIVGEDLGVLIGRQNEVLSALELITRLMVNQRVRGRSDFVVDVNGYRAKRAEALRKLALRMADQVIETDRTAVLEPMPPAERRIIHLALRDHPRVTTQSIGEGDRRKVTIVPKRD